MTTEPVTETWTYAGIRIARAGKQARAWLDASGEELWFAKTGAQLAVGSQYQVKITRDDGHVTLHGTPTYTGQHPDQATRAELWAQHTCALTRLETIRAERKAARHNALDDTIQPLIDIAATLHTGTERDALAAYILRAISRAPARRSRHDAR